MTDINSKLASLHSRISKERKILEGFEAMRAATTNQDVIRTCEAKIRESQRTIGWFEQSLRELEIRSGPHTSAPIVGIAGGSPRHIEGERRQYDSKQLNQHLHSQRAVQAQLNVGSGQDARKDGVIQGEGTSVAKINYSSLDLIKADTPLNTAKISRMIHQLEFKLHVEKQYKEGIDKMAKLYLIDGDKKARADTENKRIESKQKMVLLGQALKRYKTLDVMGELGENDDDGISEDVKNNIRRPLSGALQITIKQARDLAHAPQPKKSKHQSETVIYVKVEDTPRARTHASKNDRWNEDFEIHVDKANEVEVTIYDRVPGADAPQPIGMLWLRLSDIVEELRRRKMGAETGPGWVTAARVNAQPGSGNTTGLMMDQPVLPEGSAANRAMSYRLATGLGVDGQSSNGGTEGVDAWFAVEPEGAIMLHLNFVKSNIRKRPYDAGGLGRQGAVRKRKEEVHEQNGHQFVQKQFYTVVLCALCGEFLLKGAGMQCEDCKYACHKNCYQRVVTKCISKSNADSEKDEEQINHRIPHRFEPTTNISPNWCCHCGLVLPLGRKHARKCSEPNCGITAHAECVHLVPDFCGMSMVMANQLLSDIKKINDAKGGNRRPNQAVVSRPGRANPGGPGGPLQALNAMPPSNSDFQVHAGEVSHGDSYGGSKTSQRTDQQTADQGHLIGQLGRIHLQSGLSSTGRTESEIYGQQQQASQQAGLPYQAQGRNPAAAQQYIPPPRQSSAPTTASSADPHDAVTSVLGDYGMNDSIVPHSVQFSQQMEERSMKSRPQASEFASSSSSYSPSGSTPATSMSSFQLSQQGTMGSSSSPPSLPSTESHLSPMYHQAPSRLKPSQPPQPLHSALRESAIYQPSSAAPRLQPSSPGAQPDSSSVLPALSPFSSDPQQPIRVQPYQQYQHQQAMQPRERQQNHQIVPSVPLVTSASNAPISPLVPVPSRMPPSVVSAPSSAQQIRRRIGLDDFNFLAVLGKGNFGKVMLAEEKRSNQLYAIKVLKKEFIIENDEVESTRSEKRVFLAAARERHPFLLGLHSCFQTETRIYFVMEYVSGGDLMLHIQREQFTPRRAKFYAAEVLLALEYFHTQGIVYRDLKLDNILLTLDGHIKVADYGLCKEEMWFGKTTSTFCGTPEFMAPEIILEQKYGRAVDWWAFGVLIYEMLLGQSPFRGDDEDEIFDAILEDEPLYPIHMPKDSVSILQKLLTRDPSRRLGAGESDAAEIKAHQFFKDTNWDDIFYKRVPSPFFPNITSATDTSNFDSEFTREQPTLTPVHSTLSAHDQGEFSGFSWTAGWVPS